MAHAWCRLRRVNSPIIPPNGDRTRNILVGTIMAFEKKVQMDVLPIGKPFDFPPLLWDNSQLGMLSCDSQIRQASLNLAVKKEKCLGYNSHPSCHFPVSTVIPTNYRSAWFLTGVTIKYPPFSDLHRAQDHQHHLLRHPDLFLSLPKPKRTSPSLKILLPRLYSLLIFFHFFTVTSRSSWLSTPF